MYDSTGFRYATAAMAMALALVAASTASAGQSPRADLLFRFTTGRPGAETAVRIHILYKDPANPSGKPPAIRHLDITPPPGSRFDPSALPACAASDPQLLALGDAACRSASTLGGGTLTVMTGFTALDPLATVVTVFNTANGWIELAKDPHTGRPVGLDRLTFSNGQLVENPPFEPGAPPDGTAVREVDFTLGPRAGWARTPPTCDGTWTTRAVFGFADGSSQAVTDTMPCDVVASRPGTRTRPQHRRPRRRRRARHARRHSPRFTA